MDRVATFVLISPCTLQGAYFYRIIAQFIDQTGVETESVFGGQVRLQSSDELSACNSLQVAVLLPPCNAVQGRPRRPEAEAHPQGAAVHGG